MYIKAVLLGLVAVSMVQAAESQQALVYAVNICDVAKATRMLQCGADASGLGVLNGHPCPLLFLAASDKNASIPAAQREAMVELLLRNKASANVSDGNGTTALMCSLDSPVLVKTLLKHKADITPRNTGGANALFMSILWGSDINKRLILPLLLLHPQINEAELSYTYEFGKSRLYTVPTELTACRRLLCHAKEVEKAAQINALTECTRFSGDLIKMVINYASRPLKITVPEYPLPAGIPTDAELKETRAAMVIADEVYEDQKESEILQPRKRVKEDHGS